MDKQVVDAVQTLIDVGLFTEADLLKMAKMAELFTDSKKVRATPVRQPAAVKTQRKKRSKVEITKEALSAYLKDHTGNEAAEHFGVSSATINNKKQKYELTKKKAGKKGKKKKAKTKKGKK